MLSISRPRGRLGSCALEDSRFSTLTFCLSSRKRSGFFAFSNLSFHGYPSGPNTWSCAESLLPKLAAVKDSQEMGIEMGMRIGDTLRTLVHMTGLSLETVLTLIAVIVALLIGPHLSSNRLRSLEWRFFRLA